MWTEWKAIDFAIRFNDNLDWGRYQRVCDPIVGLTVKWGWGVSIHNIRVVYS